MAAQEEQQEGPVTTQVRDHNCRKLVVPTRDELQCQTLAFAAGQVKNHLSHWELITQDPFILSAIQHYNIEFAETPLVQISPPVNKTFSPSEKEIIQNEITKLSHKGVIEEAVYTNDSYLSNVFVRPKKDGSHRMILNLKSLNEFVAYHHFKMDTFQTAISLIRPGCFMASVDLKDAYYSIPVAPQDRKYLMFEWQGTYFQFTCLPNGLACAPRLFTKILKPVYAHLRELGHTCMGHIDDSLLVASNYHSCENNVGATVGLFTHLGFTIHPDKSILKPTQEIEFLGFLINSITMTVRLSATKADKVKCACETLLRSKNHTIRDVAHVIGLLVSSLPATDYGALYYRQLELSKIKALRFSCGNFDALMNLSEGSRVELKWWIDNITHSHKSLTVSNPDVILTTDASNLGWGAVLDGQDTGGLWGPTEQEFHINYLEMKAVLLGLKSLCKDCHDIHICVQSDNTTAVAYINSMGGVKSEVCNDMAFQIWGWCLTKCVWLSARHVPGAQNTQADQASRRFNDSVEWSLSTDVFQTISAAWGPFDIDLFASRLNNKLPSYASWRPDPGAQFTDAFCFNWETYHFYAFPPFSVISKCLQKIDQDLATGVLIVPFWKTQAWFSVLMNLLVDNPLVLPQADNLLTLPHTGAQHPLKRKIRLIACKLSGQVSCRRMFLAKQQTLLCNHGQKAQLNNTAPTSEHGWSCVVNGIPIHMTHL